MGEKVARYSAFDRTGSRVHVWAGSRKGVVGSSETVSRTAKCGDKAREVIGARGPKRVGRTRERGA